MRALTFNIIIACLLLTGCGTTQQRIGTEQLLLSDSVDRTVDQLDCSPLSGRTVYLDTSYIKAVKGTMFVNADYIVSSIRHKLIVSGCRVMDEKSAADYILEARIGALGTDQLEITYGLPANNPLNQAATLVTSVPAVPTIPEISIGKRNSALATSKIVMFAYHRETGTPVWQSGSSIHKSDAKDTWLMGAGPLQRGSIYGETTFAGLKVKAPRLFRKEKIDEPTKPVTVADAHQFVHPAVLEQQLAEAKAPETPKVVPASHEVEAKE